MHKPLRGAAIPFSLAVLVLSFLVLSLFTLTGRPEKVAAQETCAGPAVCEPKVRAISRSPATNTGYEVTFRTPVEIKAFSDSIVMELHEDIRVPRVIFPNLVRVKFVPPGPDSQSSFGFASNVSLTDQNDPRRPTSIDISHGLRSGRDSGSLLNIPSNAQVTVTFQKGAGISNPTEGGAFFWKVGVGSGPLVDAKHPNQEVIDAFMVASTDDAGTGLLVDREIQLSHEEISRGDSITVIARGYKNGYTLTVWRDANVNGMRDTGESDLCQVEVASNDIGYCDFTVSSPPFVAGSGMCPDKTDTGGNVITADLDCNFINAVDGLSNSSIIVERGTAEITDADQVLEFVGKIVADLVQGPGGDIQVQVIDFPPGEIGSVTIGGVLAEIDPLRIGASGRLSFSVPVPDNVRLGRQYLCVKMKEDDWEEGNCPHSRGVIVDISQPKAILRVFPETVLPNQRVALSGLGFHEDRGTTIDEVKFGGFILKPSRVDGGAGTIEVGRDGNWSGSVDLPIVEATTSEGTYTLRARDSLGRTGSVEVTVPPREVRVEPIWGRPGTIVKVTGTGFPSRNVHGSSVNLRVYYDAGDRFTAVTAEPDVNGNFTQEIQIPLKTPTPSSNFVRVEFDDDNGITVVTSTSHEVPGAVVRLHPDAGPPGTPFTIRGTGFRHHAPVSATMFADIDVSPGARPGLRAADRPGNRCRGYRQLHLRYKAGRGVPWLPHACGRGLAGPGRQAGAGIPLQ